MKLYKIASTYNGEIVDHRDFIGFHCQRRPRSKYDDLIVNDHGYAQEYFAFIMDSLPFELRMNAIQAGLIPDVTPDQYDDTFEEWADNVTCFLENHNIRWIFVTQNTPLSEQFGGYCYYVLLPESCVLHIFDDIGVNDIAWAYVYDGNKCSPNCIEIQENEE